MIKRLEQLLETIKKEPVRLSKSEQEFITIAEKLTEIDYRQYLTYIEKWHGIVENKLLMRYKVK